MQVSVDSVVLDKAKKRLKKLTDEWNSGVCHGVCWDMSGDEYALPYHNACHSWVGYAYEKIRGSDSIYHNTWYTEYPEKTEPFLALSCHKRFSTAKVSQEAVDAIILWMARESPFSEFILNKDDEKSLLEGGVILLCGPGGLTRAQSMWVCKVLRYANEGGQSLDVWLTLCKAGVNPLLALFVASHSRAIIGATFGHTGVDGHSSVFVTGTYDISAEELLEGKVYHSAENTYEVFKNSEVRGFKASGKVREFFKPIQKDDGWGGKVSGEAASIDTVVSRVLEWQKEGLS